MRCEGTDSKPCERCISSGLDCVFSESRRGKHRRKRVTPIPKTSKNMQDTLDSILKTVRAEESAKPNVQPPITQPTLDAPTADIPINPNVTKATVRTKSKLLADEYITWEVAEQLFDFFWAKQRQFAPFLYERYDNAINVASRSAILFDVICTVASKHYKADPSLHARCAEVVKVSIAVAALHEPSLETVQCLLLQAIFMWPIQSFQEDRTWMLVGMACRMGYDLNFHELELAPDASPPERMYFYRARTAWFSCFVVDHVLCAGMGRPYNVREDNVIRSGSDPTLYPDFPDAELIATHVDLERIIGRCFDLIIVKLLDRSGSRKPMPDFNLIRMFNRELDDYLEKWAHVNHSVKTYCNNMKLYLHAAALQYLIDNPATPGASIQGPILAAECVKDCEAMLTMVQATLVEKDVLHVANDYYHVVIGHAAIFLLKILGTRFAADLDSAHLITLALTTAQLLQDKARSPVAFAYAEYIYLVVKVASVARVDKFVMANMVDERAKSSLDVVMAGVKNAPIHGQLQQPDPPIPTSQTLSPQFSAALNASLPTEDPTLTFEPFHQDTEQVTAARRYLDDVNFWSSVGMPSYPPGDFFGQSIHGTVASGSTPMTMQHHMDEEYEEK